MNPISTVSPVNQGGKVQLYHCMLVWEAAQSWNHSGDHSLENFYCFDIFLELRCRHFILKAQLALCRIGFPTAPLPIWSANTHIQHKRPPVPLAPTSWLFPALCVLSLSGLSVSRTVTRPTPTPPPHLSGGVWRVAFWPLSPWLPVTSAGFHLLWWRSLSSPDSGGGEVFSWSDCEYVGWGIPVVDRWTDVSSFPTDILPPFSGEACSFSFFKESCRDVAEALVQERGLVA